MATKTFTTLVAFRQDGKEYPEGSPVELPVGTERADRRVRTLLALKVVEEAPSEEDQEQADGPRRARTRRKADQ